MRDGRGRGGSGELITPIILAAIRMKGGAKRVALQSCARPSAGSAVVFVLSHLLAALLEAKIVMRAFCSALVIKDDSNAAGPGE